MTGTLRLAAVQMRWRAADYADGAAFTARVVDLAREAAAGASGPALVGFPELVGMPLLATAAGVADRLEEGLAPALLGWAARRPGRWLRSAWRHRVGPLPGLLAELAPAAFALQRDAFAAAARATGATVVAGTAFLPTVAFEAARGLHVVDARVHNLALVFAPNGALVGRAAKAYLTPGAERRVGLTAGRVADLPVLSGAAGRLAVAVCLDGWYHHVLERFDGLGAEVLVQPSANDAAWRRPWPPDPSRTEEDAWLRSGLRAGLQGRASLRYGVNPMLVGDLAPLAPRGRSTIVANAALVPGEGLPGWGPGLLAIAPDDVGEAVVTADVPLPPSLAAGAGATAATVVPAGADP
jgi:predicted amidohydrolase